MYAALKTAHVALAIVTFTGFIARGVLMMTRSALLDTRFSRTAPHVVDTLFLATGVAMLVQASINPLAAPWLLAKFAGLVGYVILGMLALRRGRTPGGRIAAFVAAVAVFAWIAGVARAKSILSWLALAAG